MANIFILANRFYSTNYQNHPSITLAFTNAGLAIASDTLAQSITLFRSRNESSNSQQFDLARLGRFTTYGFSIAPLIHKWFSFLDRKYPFNLDNKTHQSPLIKKNGLFNKNNLMKQNQMIFKRVLLDQLFFAPFGICMFFGGISILEGRNFKGIKEKFDEAYIPALKMNYTIWPLVQFVNFRFLPLKYRVPFVSAVGVLWNSYLSLLNSEVPEII
ncbi:putative integral membrane protein, Mpv17/PMP22 family [Glomus cerebriforme]|uniref:Putative integral membrane protein, Mpv17/PMP22 family n=1 Tax=Glomus cerebriforme TaxID=658196 RepID=A0A397SSM2_9GLOM|nr:putative integral membrane protein, Mpv17/PMP22 family [Glomus cerebriforme]